MVASSGWCLARLCDLQDWGAAQRLEHRVVFGLLEVELDDEAQRPPEAEHRVDEQPMTTAACHPCTFRRCLEIRGRDATKGQDEVDRIEVPQELSELLGDHAGLGLYGV